MDGKRALVDELEGHVLTCVHDQNGNHVVQKAIEFCPPELRQRVVSAFAGSTLRLAQHPYGCRVVQARVALCARVPPPQNADTPHLRSASWSTARAKSRHPWA